jgi:hypothetical protein
VRAIFYKRVLLCAGKDEKNVLVRNPNGGLVVQEKQSPILPFWDHPRYADPLFDRACTLCKSASSSTDNIPCQAFL